MVFGKELESDCHRYTQILRAFFKRKNKELFYLRLPVCNR